MPNYSDLPLVSVIIPVYEDAERLRKTLQAIAQQTYPKDRQEIIVVDNSASPKVESCVAEFPGVRYLVESVRGSYAARNKGIQEAKGEIFAFTDADCLPVPNWLEKGVESLVNSPNCGLVAGEIDVFPADAERATAVELFEMITAMPQQQFVQRWHFGATANVFTFRRIFDKVGLFNATLKSGGDLEWGQRVKWAGYEVIYAPEAIVRHPARSTWQALQNKTIRIIGGVHDIHDQHRSIRAFLNSLKTDWPKPSEIAAIYNDKRLTSWGIRLKVLWVTLGVKWIRYSERIRLFAGGISQNL